MTQWTTSDNREEIKDKEVNLETIGVSSDRIDDLIDAAEREHQVSLSETVTPVTLLQDVDLRIKNSRYLDPEQKIQYSAAITEIISEVQDTSHKAILSERSAKIIDRIEENAEYPGHEEDINELKKDVYISDSLYSNSKSVQMMVRKVTVLSIILVTSILTVIMAVQIQNHEAGPDIVIVLISVILIVSVVLTFIRAMIDDSDEIETLSKALFE